MSIMNKKKAKDSITKMGENIRQWTEEREKYQKKKKKDVQSLSNQGNANQNEVSFHIHQIGKVFQPNKITCG